MNRIPLCLAALAAAISLSACNDSSDDKTSNPLKPINAKLELLDRHASGLFDKGAAEIVAYHVQSKSAFVTNAENRTLDKVDLQNISTTATTTPFLAGLSAQNIALPETATLSSGAVIQLGGANSVAIHDNLMALAVEAKVKQNDGVVLFYTLDATGQATLQKAVKAGALPDMVTFSPDGSKVLVANEGEPNANYTIDPEGSITIIDVAQGVAADEGTQLNFQAFNGNLNDNILVGNNPDPENTSHAQDFEPEYISVSKDNKWAFVSLQENNAIAKINLSGSYSIVGVYGLGFKDHGLEANALDADKDDKVANLQTHSHLWGRYQPDSIASYIVNGKHYVVTANEGDSREYIDDSIIEDNCSATAQGDLRSNTSYVWDDDDGCTVYKDEWKAKDLTDKEAPHADALFTTETQAIVDSVEDLYVSADLGFNANNNTYENLYAFGARSFSIFDEQGQLVFDSGDDFERLLADKYPDQFNTTSTKTAIDNRSDNKGPEPEALTLAYVEGHTLAIIGLERMGGLMMYDITNPTKVEFIEYVNHRNYDVDPDAQNAGDSAPEGLAFVSAKDSPNGKPLVLVANETSGTLAVYQLAVTVK